ncbi:MAG TPA: TetR/AcrR family transcriptional regulator [Xanthobacteraceae bacterium]|nr:TetR/AcrR family transcriptional regulator [Xanthobacteraceae bacterium]
MPKVSQAHLDARRAQVIEAASLCFSRRGLHGTTMQDIIRQSRLSAGAIYNYFGSKEEIIEAIADQRHAQEQQVIGNAGRHSDPGDALARLLRLFFGSLHETDERERRRVGIQLWAEALHNERLLAAVRRGVDEPRRMLATIAADAQRRGKLPRDIEPDAIARAFIALFHGFILQQAWDKRTRIKSYLAAVEAMLGLLLGKPNIVHRAKWKLNADRRPRSNRFRPR